MNVDCRIEPLEPRADMAMIVEHHPDRHRFIIQLAPDIEAFIDYEERADGVLDLQHTMVPVEWRRHGIGAELVKQTMEIARREGFRVIPSCPYIVSWLEKNVQFRDVVAET
jgi:predicted GNAT family acetyltransferase